MKLFLQASLFRRYLWVTSAVTILIFAFILGFLWFAQPDVESVNEDLQLAAQGLLLLTNFDDMQKIKKSAEKIYQMHLKLSKAKPDSADIQYALFRSGQLIASSGASSMEIIAVFKANPSTTSIFRNGWYVSAAIDDQTQSVAYFAASEQYARRAIRDALVNSSLFAALSYLLFMLLASALAALYATRPIVALSARIKALKPHAFEKLAHARIHTELGPIVSAINERTNAMKRQLDVERQFFSSAAHELRTPLAVIQAQSHAVERAIDPLERAQSIKQLQAGVQRAAHSLSNLLRLARLDSLTPATEKERLNVRDLVTDCMAFHASRAFANQQILSLDESEEVFVEGSPDDLMTILDNLIDNAINYAGVGAEISVSLSKPDLNWVCIKVCDSGPGFSESDYASAFERFKRGSQSSVHSGSGLGLAISRASAKRLGGDVSVMPRGGGGLCVSVMLESC